MKKKVNGTKAFSSISLTWEEKGIAKAIVRNNQIPYTIRKLSLNKARNHICSYNIFTVVE